MESALWFECLTFYIISPVEAYSYNRDFKIYRTEYMIILSCRRTVNKNDKNSSIHMTGTIPTQIIEVCKYNYKDRKWKSSDAMVTSTMQLILIRINHSEEEEKTSREVEYQKINPQIISNLICQRPGNQFWIHIKTHQQKLLHSWVNPIKLRM